MSTGELVARLLQCLRMGIRYAIIRGVSCLSRKQLTCGAGSNLEAILASRVHMDKENKSPDQRRRFSNLQIEETTRVPLLQSDSTGAESAKKYRNATRIAQGGMSEIFEARDVNLGRKIAMKLLASEETDQKRRRFINEARITGQLEHPNIIPVHELGINQQGKLYFTMKLVKGQSLKDVLEDMRTHFPQSQSKYTLGKLLVAFVGVCNAISFAHARGVVHRDLKPANIMLGEFGEILVADWGLALVREEGTSDADSVISILDYHAENKERVSSKIVVGTPGYMAPEQVLSGTTHIDERADIYALGAILYEILTLNYPVHANSYHEFIENVVRGKITPVDVSAPPDRHVPQDLAAIALKALQRNPDDRYASVRDMRRDIERFLSGHAVSVAKTTLLKRIGKVINRNGKAAVFLLLGGIATAGIVSYFGWNSYQHRQAARNAQKAEEKAEAVSQAFIRKEHTEQARRWITVFEDNFSDPGISQRWDVLYGTFRLNKAGRREYVQEKANPGAHNGMAYLSGGTPQALICKQPIVGDIAIEFDCRIEGRFINDISCFMSSLALPQAKKIPYNGYLLQYGAFENTQIVLQKNGQILWKKYAAPLEAGKTYHVRAEKADDHLKLIINDVEIYNVYDESPLYGADRTAVGIVNWGSEIYLDNVVIQKLAAPNKADLLDLAERYLRRGNFSAAKLMYEDILVGSLSPERLSKATLGKQRAHFLSTVQQKIPHYLAKIQKHIPAARIALDMAENGLAVNINNAGNHPASLAPLRDIPVSELTLRGFSGLTSIDLMGTSNLKVLKAASCTSLKSIAGLAGNPLEFVNLSYCRNLSDITPLRNAPLNRVELSHTKITSLTPLQNAPLNYLNLNFCSQLADISVLRNKQISTMLLAGTAITTLAPLGRAQLNELSITRTSLKDISALQGQPISNLYFSRTGVGSLSALKGCPLQLLEADYSSIASLSGISAAPLKKVSMERCPITSLKPLAGAPLRELNVSYTEVTSLEPLKGMPLTDLSICGIATTKSAPKILSDLPLAKLSCDLNSKKLLAYIYRNNELVFLNKHKRAYTLRLLPQIIKLLQGKGTGATLRQSARRIEGRLFCPIPWLTTQDSARQLCRKAGGVLACPSTESMYRKLQKYCTSLSDNNTKYHLGLTLNISTRRLVWVNGDPMREELWRSDHDSEEAYKYGRAHFMTNTFYADWMSSEQDEIASFIIQWPLESSP
ncbi:MAG: protein kinase [Chitinivibrionales bacterium]|nr:protein kinase [Chitinivibrionales bacterium]